MPFHTQLIFFRSTTSFRLLSRLPSLCLSFLFQRKYSLMCFFTKKITSSSNRQIRLIFFLDFPVSAYSNLRPALMSREKKKVQPFPPRTHPETLCTRFVFFFGSDLWRRKSYYSQVNMQGESFANVDAQVKLFVFSSLEERQPRVVTQSFVSE